MPEAVVRSVHLNYEVVGDRGPWVALTPGSRRSYAELIPLSRRIADHGFRVLLHDRRNCGRSEVKIEDSSAEHELWADDLHALCGLLGAAPAYVGGSSAGGRLALLFALRHSAACKGLLLWRITGGSTAAGKLAETYYGDYIKLAEAGGMEAVCRSEHFADSIAARPANRDNLMRMDPRDFIRIMAMWREKFLEDANKPVVGATEPQLQSLAVPACLIAGNDRIHPPAIARKVKRLIPRAELHEDVVARRADDNLLQKWDQNEWAAKEDEMLRIFVEFLRRAEAAA